MFAVISEPAGDSACLEITLKGRDGFMKIGRLALAALPLLLVGGGCAPVATQAGGADAAPDPAHSSRNALDWAGTYKGVLPCADCEGIETIVTLGGDGAYSTRSRYLGKGDGNSFSTQGRFTWDDRGGSILLSGDQPARYLVGENRLIRLAQDGSRITGALADHYVLVKMDESITEKYWKLVELHGKPVPALDREPHFILSAQDNRISGYAGCNGFGGSYTLDEKTSRIRFGQMASTMMACDKGMDVERGFHDVLRQADNYSLNGDSMTLNRGRMAPLARFEAVYLQ